MGKPQENLRKTLRKPQENHRKTTRKPEENQRKTKGQPEENFRNWGAIPLFGEGAANRQPGYIYIYMRNGIYTRERIYLSGIFIYTYLYMHIGM